MKSRTSDIDLSKLTTEQQNARTLHLDQMSALEIAQAINREDQTVALAIEKALIPISRAMELVADSLHHGGRLIYVGAGTSGRLGALDASEIPPTFGINPKRIRHLIAGGKKALYAAVEDEEDSHNLGKNDIAKLRPSKNDIVIGIAASGRTPYTIAALQHAKKKGARTVALVCNRNSALERTADLAIVIDVGPEVISGSTRMKAGTAQKLVLNMISTGAMVRLGYVYGNLMVNVTPRNHKLRERGITILQKVADVTREEAERALRATRGEFPVALVMLKTAAPQDQARKSLKASAGQVRQAIERLRGSRT